jgi:L-seryl-tRNA(Ser) seleniumtransferase
LPVVKDKLNELMRRLPQVDAVLMAEPLQAALATYRHDVVTRLVRENLQRYRQRLQKGGDVVPTAARAASAVAARLAELSAPLIKPVVNASGIVLHTNLGRALLTEPAQQAVASIAGCYCNLEVDLTSGKRTRRDVTLEPLLKALTGCEAATVVNNNSGAVYLILHTLAAGREVITSRGELVEIGGSYRVPDVVHASGCKLVEVGTTNRTRIGDYERVITSDTALILKTHTSNYRVVGFTEDAGIAELVELGQRHGIPVVVDLGSGYIAPEAGPQLPELEVITMLNAQPDLLCFSGDKLLGGPQAGIALGNREIIGKLRASPLWRVLRIDKFTVAALGATLAGHLRRRGESEPEITQRNHLAHTPEALRELVGSLAAKLRKLKPAWKIAAVEASCFFGGGTLPEESIPSWAVTFEPPGLSADKLDEIMRHGDPPVVGYMQAGTYALNMLALLPGDDELLLKRLGEIAG